MVHVANQLPRNVRVQFNYLAGLVQRDPEKGEPVVSLIRALARRDDATADSIIRNEWHKPCHGMEDLMKSFREVVRKEQAEFARTRDPVYDHMETLLECADALS